MSRKIDDATLAVLSSATITDNSIILNSGQLERNRYVAVNKVLEAMGGKWNRKVKGHVFDASPEDKLEAVLLTGEYDTPADYGYFPTPSSLIDEIIALADLSPGMLVLEPSAGRGSIVDKLILMVDVTCYELQKENWEYLMMHTDADAHCCDFLTVEPDPIYDRVIMNPPFARQQDIDHVTHALKFLKPGGRLVSIMSSGITFRENKKTRDFLLLLAEFYALSITHNPPETFKLSGTLVNTVTLYVEANQND